MNITNFKYNNMDNLLNKLPQLIENQEKLYLCLQNGLCQLDLDSLDQSTSPKKFCVPSINIDGVDYPLDEEQPLQIASDI